jgi:hypothetical protein
VFFEGRNKEFNDEGAVLHSCGEYTKTSTMLRRLNATTRLRVSTPCISPSKDPEFNNN